MRHFLIIKTKLYKDCICKFTLADIDSMFQLNTSKKEKDSIFYLQVAYSKFDKCPFSDVSLTFVFDIITKKYKFTHLVDYDRNRKSAFHK